MYVKVFLKKFQQREKSENKKENNCSKLSKTIDTEFHNTHPYLLLFFYD